MPKTKYNSDEQKRFVILSILELTKNFDIKQTRFTCDTHSLLPEAFTIKWHDNYIAYKQELENIPNYVYDGIWSIVYVVQNCEVVVLYKV